MKEFKEKLQVVILCAGEGSRIRDINSNLPKSLIQIQSLNNKPLLEIIINDLLYQGLSNLIIISGFKGKLIDTYISDLKSQNPLLKNQIITLNAHPNYKKGPLFTLLTLLDYPEINRKENNFLVFPGDTIFDQVLLNKILMIIGREIENFRGKPIIFYKRVKVSEINKNTISAIKIVKKLNVEFLTQIEEINISNNEEKSSFFNQIIPIFFFSYEFLLYISQIQKSSNSNKIKDILNEVCKRNLHEVIAFKITSKGDFYDIDTVYDLAHLNKEKSGQ